MRRNKGITLIALVITIIVLLILAGVSLATLTGQNGILRKANIAGEESKKAEYKEALAIIGNRIAIRQNIRTMGWKNLFRRI